MTDTSWDFEGSGEGEKPAPDPSSTAPGVAPPSQPTFSPPSGPPLGRTVSAPTSPSRPVGNRTGAIPPPLPSPPVKERRSPLGAQRNVGSTVPPSFHPPTSPPTDSESAGRLATTTGSGAKPKGRWGVRALVAFLAGALISGAAFTAGTIVAEDESASPVPTTTPVVNTTPAPTTPPAPPAEGSENPAAFVAADLGPSVVQVVTDFGTGSGVVYRSNGLIMTNNHVIEGASQIFVRDFQGRTVAASLVGADARADIAVLQVDELGLPVADLALGQELQVGQTAIAIGSPFDLTRTVTAGIISALNRPLENQGGTFTAMIQTDAPINPGNSGGPLANRNGEVIGINTAIRTDGVSNSNVGVGFAVPIDTAYRVAERIVDGDPLEPGFLGVGAGQPAIGDVGVVIDNISEGSGAEQAGLRSGDRVLTVDGAPVTDFRELAGLIATNFPGDEVQLEIVRESEPLTVTATLGER